MTTPTIEELLARLEEQQARIELLESRTIAPAASPAADEQAESGPDRPGMTRRGMVKTAAAGAAGIVGAMLIEPEGVASAADAGPASFTSSTTKPAVTATNTGKGNALSAHAKSGVTIHASQTSAGSGAAALRATIDATNGAGTGVLGISPKGTGVSGTSRTGVGVAGSSGSTAANAVALEGTITSTSPGSSSAGVRGVNKGTGNYAVAGVTTSGNGVYGQVSTASQAGVVGRQQASSGNWAVFGFGNIGATGTKSAVVPAEDGNGHLTLYCVESPECWFEDFGSARLSAGLASVRIDPEFAQTIHTGEYHVFVQAEGECRGLSVRDKTPAGFVVQELGGGTSSASFAYRIVGRRKDVSAPRLNRVTPPDARAEAR